MITLVYPRTPQTMKSGGKSCPLGVQYLASYLISKGIKTSVIDFTFTNWKDYERKLVETNPDFIGFSVQTPIAQDGLRAIRIARKACPKSKIIIGGAHATVATKSLIKNKDIDFIVIGEGEKALLNIVTGKTKKRIVQETPIENLDDLPFPKRDLMNYTEYLKQSPYISLMVSRGCPFNCLFCQPTQRKLFGDKVRMRTPENVIAEVKEIVKNYGSDIMLDFQDDTFTWNAQWLSKFCRLIKPLNLLWKCNTRVNVVDEKKLSMMKDSGCVFICYGIESGSQKILDFMRKGITVQQIKDAFRMTHDACILTIAFVIIGSPTETKEDLEKTVSLIREIRPDGLQVSIMTPLIGTDLEKYCVNNGISNIKSLSDYHYCLNEYPIKLQHLTKSDIIYYRRKIYAAWNTSKYKNAIKYLRIVSNPKTFHIIFGFFRK
jgi:radical SAM superfamily enzyme YgiQ (UPF0313 family)